MKGLDISESLKDGFNVVTESKGWRVAIKNSENDRYEAGSGRHMDSDEVFILLEGATNLLIGEEREPVKMEKGKIYNVRKGTFHACDMKAGSKLLIVENDEVNITESLADYLAKK